jgi:hypothetical protein
VSAGGAAAADRQLVGFAVHDRAESGRSDSKRRRGRRPELRQIFRPDEDCGGGGESSPPRERTLVPALLLSFILVLVIRSYCQAPRFFSLSAGSEGRLGAASRETRGVRWSRPSRPPTSNIKDRELAATATVSHRSFVRAGAYSYSKQRLIHKREV